MDEPWSLARIDILIAASWILANILLLIASWQVVIQWFPEDAGAARVLLVSVIWCASLTAVLLILGIGSLFQGAFMVLGVSLLAIPFVCCRGSTKLPSPSGGLAHDLSPYWLVLSGFLGAHCIVNGLLQIPTDFDCLMYHLPLVDSWLQAGSLYAPDCCHWSNPAGSELLAAWCCAPFSGDFLAPLNNLPIVVVWASATLQFCRLVGMKGYWPELATTAALSVYALLHETDDASNDLMVAAFFMASGVFALRYLQSQSTSILLLLAISIGLLCGVKFFAIGYAAVVWTAFLIGMVLTSGYRKAFIAGMSTLGVAALFGGYWYCRNVAYTGLPLYPLGDPATLAYPNLWETSLIGNTHPSLWRLFLLALWNAAGPLHCAAAVMFPAVVTYRVWKFGTSLQSAPILQTVSGGVSLFMLVGAAAVLWVTPYLVEDQPGSLNHLQWAYTPARYGLCFLTISVVSTMGLISETVPQRAALLRTTIFSALSLTILIQWGCLFQSRAKEFHFTDTSLLGIDLAVLLLGVALYLRSKRTWPVTALICLLPTLLLVSAIGALSWNWHANFNRHFDTYFKTTAFTTLGAHEYDNQPMIVLDYRPYAFYGSRRQHQIINARRFVSEEWLLRELDFRNVRLATALGNQGYVVDRYHGAFEFLSEDDVDFCPIINRSFMTVVEYLRSPAHDE